MLEEYGFKTGVEVGVKQGAYAKIVLSQWKSCQSYKLVDAWRHQENYVDSANVDQATQDRVEIQLEMLYSDFGCLLTVVLRMETIKLQPVFH